MKKTHVLGTALLFPLIFFVACQSSRKAGGDPFERFRSAMARVPGWVEQREQYRSFTAQELYGIIDGGATAYEKQGLVRGIGLFCTNKNSNLDIYFEDFGTSVQAGGMVNEKRNIVSEVKTIPRANADSAIYEPVLGGCSVYWAKNRYYVEMALTGYDSLTNALRDAMVLLDSIVPVVNSR